MFSFKCIIILFFFTAVGCAHRGIPHLLLRSLPLSTTASGLYTELYGRESLCQSRYGCRQGQGNLAMITDKNTRNLRTRSMFCKQSKSYKNITSKPIIINLPKCLSIFFRGDTRTALTSIHLCAF